MAQDTLVLKLDRPARERFRNRLDAGDFEYRPVPHARFSARGEGVVATLYESGKLVVQGRDVEVFVARYLDEADARPTPPKPAAAPLSPADYETVIGSDEVGKGDFLGPLVVVAFKLEADDAAALAAGDVMDSKKLSDERILRLGPALRDRFEHAIERLDPPEYNREHRRCGNLNEMLADLHARAIRRLAGRGDHVVVDRFAREELVARRLSDLELRLVQIPRAEKVLAVAAASIVARCEFLEAMGELSERFAVDLHKGAGAPADDSAREFVALHGLDSLSEVAKVHFKNTSKLADGERRRS